MTVIDEFIRRYRREYNYYQAVAEFCRRQCEAGLVENGVRAIVTHRAKNFARLRDKLEQRGRDGRYESVDSIYRDIVDLAGVRIALYFPGDDGEVRKLIDSTFIVDDAKVFGRDTRRALPYQYQFDGYSASHYIVRLKPDSLPDDQSQYADTRIEIQVASVLMHAWAEVEHDLVYKPFSGELSEDEYAILDEINGLVLTGEIALKRLQKAVRVRVSKRGNPFNNHYELAQYLYDAIHSTSPDLDTEPVMGRADVLLRFLQLAQMDKPESLETCLPQLDLVLDTRPIVEQVVDVLLAGNPQLYSVYAQAKRDVSERNPYGSSGDKPRSAAETDALGRFISAWIAFEAAYRSVMEFRNAPRELTILSGSSLRRAGMFPANVVQDLDSFRRLRSRILHGARVPDVDVLIGAANRLDSIISEWREHTQGDERDVIERTLKTVRYDPPPGRSE